MTGLVTQHVTTLLLPSGLTAICNLRRVEVDARQRKAEGNPSD